MNQHREDCEIHAARQRSLRWLLLQSLSTLVWCTFLGLVAWRLPVYKERCESRNVFGTYALVLSIYAVVHGLVDIAIGGVFVVRATRFLNERIMEKWARMMTSDVADYPREGHEIATKMPGSENLLGLGHAMEQEKEQVRQLDSVLRLSTPRQRKTQQPRQRPDDNFISDLPRWPEERPPPREGDGSRPSRLRRASGLLFGASAIPLLTTMLFIFAGTNSANEIRQAIGPNVTVPRVCADAVVVNWAVMGYGLLVNLVNLIPAAIDVFLVAGHRGRHDSAKILGESGVH